MSATAGGRQWRFSLLLGSQLRILLVLGAILGLAVIGGAFATDSPSAHAGVNGVSCGDTIGPWEYVSLDADLNCDTDPALTVVGPAVLNLNGYEVHCNNPSNNGIEIEGWYATVKNGLITDCREGVVVGGYGYHRVRGLEITDSAITDAGIVVNSKRNRIEDNNVHDNDGTGILVNGSYNTLKRNRSDGNDLHGIQVFFSNRNYLYDNTADGNLLDGFLIVGNDNFFWHNSANGNTIFGFSISGDFNVFLLNSAIGNTDDGIVNNFGANDNTYKFNTALDNDTDLFDFQENCDNNVWKFNTFVTKDPACIN